MEYLHANAIWAFFKGDAGLLTDKIKELGGNNTMLPTIGYKPAKDGSIKLLFSDIASIAPKTKNPGSDIRIYLSQEQGKTFLGALGKYYRPIKFAAKNEKMLETFDIDHEVILAEYKVGPIELNVVAGGRSETKCSSIDVWAYYNKNLAQEADPFEIVLRLDAEDFTGGYSERDGLLSVAASHPNTMGLTPVVYQMDLSATAARKLLHAMERCRGVLMVSEERKKAEELHRSEIHYALVNLDEISADEEEGN